MLYPESLPRYPHIIMVHHVITLALLSHPLRFPQDAHFTCLARPPTALLLPRPALAAVPRALEPPQPPPFPFHLHPPAHLRTLAPSGWHGGAVHVLPGGPPAV